MGYCNANWHSLVIPIIFIDETIFNNKIYENGIKKKDNKNEKRIIR